MATSGQRSHESAEPAMAVRKYNCSICSTSFQRREHFERHRHTHFRTKDFQCEVCNKSFARKDTLRRHLAIHRETRAKVQTAVSRASRACTNCVKSKQRCTGSQPCERCSRKSWHCEFPNSSRQASGLGGEDLQAANSHKTCDRARKDVGAKDVRPAFQAPWASSVSAINPSETVAPSIQNSTGVPCTPFTFPVESRHPAQESEATSILEPFLLWPIDSAFDDYNTASGFLSYHTTPTMFANTMDPSTHVPIGDEIARNITLQEAQVHATMSEVYVSEDAMTQEDHDILVSEDYGHVLKPSTSTYGKMCALCVELFPGPSELLPPGLPTLEILHVCAQLYFEHFHTGFPLLHQGTFEVRCESWLLYLAVAAVGCQYSRLSTRAKTASSLLRVIKEGLLRKLSSGTSLQNDIGLAQATLLFNFSLLLGGTLEGIMHAQYQRNVLVTMCRPLLIPGLLFERSGVLSSPNISIENWSRWVAIESWKRVAYFTWLSECLQLIIFDLPPLITVGDMHLSMPCNDELWQCENFRDWERIKNIQGGLQQYPSVLALLKMEAISQDHIRSMGSSALWISIFAIYVGERQASQQPCHHLVCCSCDNLGSQTSQFAEGFCATQHKWESIDSTLGRFQEASSHASRDSALTHIAGKFSRLLRLLRFIPYRLMYVASGWMSQHQEAEVTAQRVAQLLRANPKQARRCLIHAAQLFRVIRTQSQFEAYDSFVLLMATLYIWIYDRFMVEDPLEQHNSGDTPQMLRIDQDLKEEILEQWVEGDHEVCHKIHIVGIGTLNGRESVSRILRESMRILNHDKAWSKQANAIQRSLHQVSLGEAPSF